MKMVRYLLSAILIGSLSTSLLARHHRSRRSKNSLFTNNKHFNWWPRNTYQKTENNISLLVKALSEEETSNLFLGDGKYLITMRGSFFISQPIVPLHITIKNENSFPIILNESSIDLGRYWIGIQHRPVNLRNVSESLNNSWFWSNQLEQRNSFIHSFTGKLIATTTSYEVNHDPLLYCSFLILDKWNLSSLFSLESGILFNDYKLPQSSVIIEEGKAKELLLFVWGKHITSNFSITIAKNKFKVNLLTQF